MSNLKKPSWLDEFKTFIMRGNVMNLAVGVIVGGAFNAIVSSLSADIIMPIISIFTGGINFAEWTINVGPAVLTVGNFVNAVLQFVILALVVFWLVRIVNKMLEAGKKEEEAPAPAPEAPKGPTTEELLAEIRDLLKDK
ncbi:MAG: large conductance mechanosensitive channel protein MscL [Oscillospiraceae bacterium]|nr:large conductance mechanosensitive channel protein MscL [Oscillospiraceae bacterium]